MDQRRTLLVLRHAQTEDVRPGSKDSERRLTPDGERHAQPPERQQSTAEAVARDDGLSATLGMLTHEARETELQACVRDLAASSFVGGSIRVLRVVGL